MNTEAALLRAIQADPDEDMPRLAYADWLDEHGQPERAEFIRVQMELSRTTRDDSKWLTLHYRQEDLLRANRDRWLGDLPRECRPKVSFERGFVAGTFLTGKQFLRWAEKLKQRTPLGSVGLNATAGMFADLTTRPVFAGVRELTLTALTTAAEFGLLARCPHLASLRSLCLWYVPDFTPTMLASLLRSTGLPALRSLQMNDLPFHALKSNHLKGCGVLRQLKELKLWRCRLGAAHWPMLLSEPHGIREPEQLHLWQCGIGPPGMSALTRCEPLRGLKELSLYGNDLGAEGAEILAACPLFENLRILELQGFPGGIGDAGARALAQSRTLKRLETLNLASNQITDVGARALLRTKQLPRLHTLDVQYNPGISEDTLTQLRARYRIPW